MRDVDWTLVAFSAAFLAWGVAEVRYEFSFITIAGSVVAAVGFAVASVDRIAPRTAYVIGVIGLMPFYVEGFWPAEVSVYWWALVLFAAGLIILAIAGARKEWLLVGCVVGVAGPILWVPTDWGNWWWQPGNLLAGVAFVMTAWNLRSRKGPSSVP